jgi:hypothetical protein
VVGAVLVIGAVAAVDALRGGSSPAAAQGGAVAAAQANNDRLRGPNVPTPGALPGMLVVAESADCRLRTLPLSTVVVSDAGPRTGCEVWASPAGGWAVATASRGAGPRAPRELSLVRLGEEIERIDHDLEPALGPVAWSPDGARAAWCVAQGETVVLDVGQLNEHRVPGCAPAFGGDGAVFTVPADPLDARILRNGETFLGTDALAGGVEQALDSGVDTGPATPVQVAALAVGPDDRVAVSVLVFEDLGSVMVLEVWDRGALQASFRLPTLYGLGSSRLGQFLRFSPNGNELAVGYRPFRERVSIVDLRLADVTLQAVDQQGIAWSPDGSWLAIAARSRVDVFGETRGEPVYSLPLETAAIAWAGAPSQ